MAKPSRKNKRTNCNGYICVRSFPRARSARTSGSLVPPRSAPNIAWAETPMMSVIAAVSLMFADSRSLWRRFTSRVHSSLGFRALFRIYHELFSGVYDQRHRSLVDEVDIHGGLEYTGLNLFYLFPRLFYKDLKKLTGLLCPHRVRK